MCYVYVIISCKQNKRYIGISKDPLKRLKEHNSGMVTSTKGKRPFTLVYTEKCENIMTARKKEKYFKSGFGRKWLNRTLNKINIKD